MAKFVGVQRFSIEADGKMVLRQATPSDVAQKRQIYRVNVSFLEHAPDHLQHTDLGKKIRVSEDEPIKNGKVFFWDKHHGFKDDELEEMPENDFFGVRDEVFVVEADHFVRQWDGTNTR